MGLQAIRHAIILSTSRFDLRLGVGLSTLLFGTRNLSSHDVLPDVVLLRQVEELADLSRTLGTEAFGKNVVGESRDFVLTLLDDDYGQNSDIGAHYTASDGLAPAFARATGAIARVAIGKEKTDTVWDEDTLLHGETLLIVTTGNTEDVAFPFFTERVCGYFLCNPLLIEDTAGEGEII